MKKKDHWTKLQGECEKILNTQTYDDLDNLFLKGASSGGARPKIQDWIIKFPSSYDEDKKSWRLSLAYDLTYSNSLGGQHATTVNGNGENPGLDDILAVAKTIGFNKTTSKRIANEICDCVHEMLKEYIL